MDVWTDCCWGWAVGWGAAADWLASSPGRFRFVLKISQQKMKITNAGSCRFLQQIGSAKLLRTPQDLPDNETEKEVFLGVFFQPRSLQWQEAGVEFVTSSQGHNVTILDHFAHVGRHSQPEEGNICNSDSMMESFVNVLGIFFGPWCGVCTCFCSGGMKRMTRSCLFPHRLMRAEI